LSSTSRPPVRLVSPCRRRCLHWPTRSLNECASRKLVRWGHRTPTGLAPDRPCGPEASLRSCGSTAHLRAQMSCKTARQLPAACYRKGRPRHVGGRDQ
jgi:hypothetical protein